MSVLRARPVVDGRIRVGPWRGDLDVAHLTPLAATAVTAAAVQRCVERLQQDGCQQAFTAALSPAEQHAFLTAGFEVHERLHLLVRSLDEPLVDVPGIDLRRGKRSDRPAVLALDAVAFSSFWHLDDTGLDDALAATPTSRFRVATDRGPGGGHGAVVGYSVTGRAGARGYLQRLAVAPAAQRQGIGTALVLDGMRWLRRRGVREALVNTQVGNDVALRLYEGLGFRRRSGGLAVLRRSLGDTS